MEQLLPSDDNILPLGLGPFQFCISCICMPTGTCSHSFLHLRFVLEWAAFGWGSNKAPFGGLLWNNQLASRIVKINPRTSELPVYFAVACHVGLDMAAIKPRRNSNSAPNPQSHTCTFHLYTTSTLPNQFESISPRKFVLLISTKVYI